MFGFARGFNGSAAAHPGIGRQGCVHPVGDRGGGSFGDVPAAQWDEDRVIVHHVVQAWCVIAGEPGFAPAARQGARRAGGRQSFEEGVALSESGHEHGQEGVACPHRVDGRHVVRAVLPDFAGTRHSPQPALAQCHHDSRGPPSHLRSRSTVSSWRAGMGASLPTTCSHSAAASASLTTRTSVCGSTRRASSDTGEKFTTTCVPAARKRRAVSTTAGSGTSKDITTCENRIPRLSADVVSVASTWSLAPGTTQVL